MHPRRPSTARRSPRPRPWPRTRPWLLLAALCGSAPARADIPADPPATAPAEASPTATAEALNPSDAPDPQDAPYAVAAAAFEVGDLPKALHALGLRPSPTPGVTPPLSADLALSVASKLMDDGYFFAARLVLAETERAHPDDPRLLPALSRALHDDPRFVPAPAHLQADADLDAIKALGGGSTVSLKFIKNKENIGAFKPNQARMNTYPRAEIAAWRLCALLRCGFFIPRNTPTFVTQRDFNALYERVPDEAQRKYAEANFADLRFSQHPTLGLVLHGTLKTWLPQWARLPIESRHIWRPWLTLDPAVGLPLSDLNTPAIQHITAADTRESSKEYDNLALHMGDMTALQLARQVSDVLAFDFLVNNWDRMSDRAEYRGGNCFFIASTLVSLDNGAAFTGETAITRAVENIKEVERFSPQLIRALRALEREPTLHLLFPNPTAGERARFDHFWHRRTQLLDRVDALSMRYGRDAVLSLP